MRIGTALEIELTLPALPCKKNAQWFHDGNFMRMHHVQHPGETRWYARVITDGEIRTGDRVVVEPTSASA
jgi:MOSC domain-containing protein YiiM